MQRQYVSSLEDPAHTSVKAEGAADISMPHVAGPTAICNSQSADNNLRGMNFVQAPKACDTHIEIVKLLWKVMEQKVVEYPTWTPPSRDYIDKALTCPMCQLTFNEVDSVVVCDACEKGYHIKCLQCATSSEGFPKGEWHCDKCLTLSNGKPFPAKYGRIIRNIRSKQVQ